MSEVSEEGLPESLNQRSPELENLMLKYQQADHASAELFLGALIPILTRFFISMPDGRDAADDLVQETLLRLHRARHTYRPPEPVLPWVFAIARHVRVDQYRKRRRTALREEPVEPDVLQSRAVSVEQPADELPDFETLMTFLPESQREVVTMLKVLGMSGEEVARVTSSTVGSVKQKAHRAYGRLRTILQKPSGPATAAAND
jgi:RNA polymerase sigma-70 factor (ECF subfamily)